MISRTSWAHRQATAIFAAHWSASCREGTSRIEKPPTTALVSGNGPSLTDPSAGDDARLLTLDTPAEDPHPGLLRRSDHLVRSLGDLGQVLLREGHRSVVERDQVSRHVIAPPSRDLSGRLNSLARIAPRPTQLLSSSDVAAIRNSSPGPFG